MRRDLAIRGSEDTGNSVDYSLPPNEQDASDHFPLVVTFSTTGPGPVAGGGEPTREQLLEALQRIEERLRQLGEDVEGVRSLVEGLDD